MNQNEFLLLQQMFQGSDGWLLCILLVMFCYLSVSKAEKIHTPSLFRYSIIVFVIALLAPAIISLLVQSPSAPLQRGYAVDRQFAWITLLQSCIQPCLLAISIAMLLFSIAPKHTSVVQNVPTVPRPHPLDE